MSQKSAQDNHVSVSSDKDGASDMPKLVVPPMNMKDYVNKNDVLRAEVLWTIKLDMSHQSYRSSDDISALFGKMFPDSLIAQKFSCTAKKCSYLCVFGIADHMRNGLMKHVNGSWPITLMFNESLNKKSQQKQMDVHICFFEGNIVKTRYMDSNKPSSMSYPHGEENLPIREIV